MKQAGKALLTTIHFNLMAKGSRLISQMCKSLGINHKKQLSHLTWESENNSLGQPRGRVWGGRREEGSGWGTQVYLWQIHFDIWQN